MTDTGFAYWHSATFNNDGTKIIFTDEWGGGGRPRCRAWDPLNWGADAIYDIVDGKLEYQSHYKMPAPQLETENCVAHNGSIIPISNMFPYFLAQDLIILAVCFLIIYQIKVMFARVLIRGFLKMNYYIHQRKGRQLLKMFEI